MKYINENYYYYLIITMKYYYIKITTFYPNNGYDKKIMCEDFVKINNNHNIEYPDISSNRYDISFIYNSEYEDATRITYDMDGNILTKEWFDENGNYFRKNGLPTLIEYMNGCPKYKEYWENGEKKIRIEVNG